MPIYFKQNGQWKNIEAPYIKREGEWILPEEMYIKKNGEWRLIFEEFTFVVETVDTRETPDEKVLEGQFLDFEEFGVDETFFYDQELIEASSVNATAVDSSRGLAAIGGGDDTVYVYDENFAVDIQSNNPSVNRIENIKDIQSPAKTINGLDFYGSENLLGAAAGDVFIFDENFVDLSVFESDEGKDFTDLEFDEQRGRLAAGIRGQQVYIYEDNGSGWQQVNKIGTSANVTSVSWRESDGYLAVGVEGNVELYDNNFNSLSEDVTAASQTGTVKVEFSGSDRLAVVDASGVKVYTNNFTETADPQDGSGGDVAWDDNEFLAHATDNGFVYTYDGSNGSYDLLKEFDDGERAFESVAWDGQNEHIIAGESESGSGKAHVLATGVQTFFDFGEEGENFPQRQRAGGRRTLGPFETGVDGLKPDTIYEYRAGAFASEGRTVIDVDESLNTFRTVDMEVETNLPSDVQTGSATLSGEIITFDSDEANNQNPVASFEWGKKAEGLTNEVVVGSVSVDPDGTFTENVSGLEGGVQHIYKAKSKFGGVTVLGDQVEFGTADVTAQLDASTSDPTVYGPVFLQSSVADTTKTEAITVEEASGTGDYDVSGATISGTNSGDFTIVNTTFPFTVSAGGTRDIEVEFNPSERGSREAVIDIDHEAPNGPNPITVGLEGTGERKTVLEVTNEDREESGIDVINLDAFADGEEQTASVAVEEINLDNSATITSIEPAATQPNATESEWNISNRPGNLNSGEATVNSGGTVGFDVGWNPDQNSDVEQEYEVVIRYNGAGIADGTEERVIIDGTLQGDATIRVDAERDGDADSNYGFGEILVEDGADGTTQKTVDLRIMPDPIRDYEVQEIQLIGNNTGDFTIQNAPADTTDGDTSTTVLVTDGSPLDFQLLFNPDQRQTREAKIEVTAKTPDGSSFVVDNSPYEFPVDGIGQQASEISLVETEPIDVGTAIQGGNIPGEQATGTATIENSSPDRDFNITGDSIDQAATENDLEITSSLSGTTISNGNPQAATVELKPSSANGYSDDDSPGGDPTYDATHDASLGSNPFKVSLTGTVQVTDLEFDEDGNVFDPSIDNVTIASAPDDPADTVEITITSKSSGNTKSTPVTITEQDTFGSIQFQDGSTTDSATLAPGESFSKIVEYDPQNDSDTGTEDFLVEWDNDNVTETISVVGVIGATIDITGTNGGVINKTTSPVSFNVGSVTENETGTADIVASELEGNESINITTSPAPQLTNGNQYSLNTTFDSTIPGGGSTSSTVEFAPNEGDSNITDTLTFEHDAASASDTFEESPVSIEVTSTVLSKAELDLVQADDGSTPISYEAEPGVTTTSPQVGFKEIGLDNDASVTGLSILNDSENNFNINSSVSLPFTVSANSQTDEPAVEFAPTESSSFFPTAELEVTYEGPGTNGSTTITVNLEGEVLVDSVADIDQNTSTPIQFTGSDNESVYYQDSITASFSREEKYTIVEESGKSGNDYNVTAVNAAGENEFANLTGVTDSISGGDTVSAGGSETGTVEFSSTDSNKPDSGIYGTGNFISIEHDADAEGSEENSSISGPQELAAGLRIEIIGDPATATYNSGTFNFNYNSGDTDSKPVPGSGNVSFPVDNIPENSDDIAAVVTSSGTSASNVNITSNEGSTGNGGDGISLNSNEDIIEFQDSYSGNPQLTVSFDSNDVTETHDVTIYKVNKDGTIDTSSQLAQYSGEAQIPILSIIPTSYDFGTVSSSDTKTFTVTNEGTATATNVSSNVSNNSGSDFSEQNGFSGISISAGSNETFDVVYAPDSTAGDQGDASASGDNSSISAPISGDGQPAQEEISLVSANSGDGSFTSKGETQDFQFENTGDLDLSGVQIEFQGTDESEFIFVGESEPVDVGTLTTGSTVTVTVEYQPSTTDSDTADLFASDNNPDSPNTTETVILDGSGGTTDVIIGNLSFGTGGPGDTLTDSSVDITNNGNVPATIDGVNLSTTDITGTNVISSTTSSGVPSTVGAGQTESFTVEATIDSGAEANDEADVTAAVVEDGTEQDSITGTVNVGNPSFTFASGETLDGIPDAIEAGTTESDTTVTVENNGETAGTPSFDELGTNNFNVNVPSSSVDEIPSNGTDDITVEISAVSTASDGATEDPGISFTNNSETLTKTVEALNPELNAAAGTDWGAVDGSETRTFSITSNDDYSIDTASMDGTTPFSVTGTSGNDIDVTYDPNFQDTDSDTDTLRVTLNGVTQDLTSNVSGDGHVNVSNLSFSEGFDSLQISPGSTKSDSVTVSNDGNQVEDVASNITVDSTPSFLSASDISFSGFSSSLSGGGNSQGTVTVNMPSGTSEGVNGTVTIGFNNDSSTTSAQISTPSEAQISVNGTTIQGTDVDVNGTFNADVTFENTGSASGTPNPSVSATNGNVTSESYSTVSANSTETQTGVISGDVTGSDGQTLTLNVDSVQDTESIVGTPSISITNVTINDSDLDPGGSFSADVTIDNSGTASGTPSDPTITNGSTTDSFNSVAAGTTDTQTINGSVDNVDGVNLVVDVEGVTDSELIDSPADINVTSSLSLSSKGPGDSINNSTTTIQNVGEETAGSLSANVTSSTNINNPSASIDSGSTLSGGQTSNVTLTGDIPSSANDGDPIDATISFTGDGTSSTSNTSDSSTVSNEFVDLQTTSELSFGNADPGASVSDTFEVTNNGTIGANVSGNKNVNGDTNLNSESISGPDNISAGGSETYTVSGTVDSGTTAGTSISLGGSVSDGGSNASSSDSFSVNVVGSVSISGLNLSNLNAGGSDSDAVTVTNNKNTSVSGTVTASSDNINSVTVDNVSNASFNLSANGSTYTNATVEVSSPTSANDGSDAKITAEENVDNSTTSDTVNVTNANYSASFDDSDNFYDFGTVNGSDSKLFGITADGNRDVTVSSINFGQDLSNGSGGIFAGSTIAQGTSEYLDIEYNPPDADTTISNEPVTVFFDNASSITIDISGDGETVSGSVSISNLGLASNFDAGSSTSDTVTVTNNKNTSVSGTVTASSDNANVTASVTNGSFSLSPGGSTNNAATVEASAGSGVSDGTTATITATAESSDFTNNDTTTNVTVDNAEMDFTTTTIDFGTVSVDGTLNQGQVEVINNGSGAGSLDVVEGSSTPSWVSNVIGDSNSSLSSGSTFTANVGASVNASEPSNTDFGNTSSIEFVFSSSTIDSDNESQTLSISLPAQNASVSVSESSLSFSDGSGGSQTVTIYNTGNQDYDVSTSISGTDSDKFSITSNNLNNTTISAPETPTDEDVSIGYSPGTDTSSHSATLDITFSSVNGGTTPSDKTVSLSGNGAPGAQLSINTPNGNDYVRQGSNDNSSGEHTSITYELQNTGDAEASPTFNETSGNYNFSGTPNTVSAGNTETFTVSHSGSITGTTIEVDDSNSNASASQSVNIHQISYGSSGSFLNFGLVDATTTPSKTADINNDGNTTESISVNALTSFPEFTTTSEPGSISSGSTGSLTVEYNPGSTSDESNYNLASANDDGFTLGVDGETYGGATSSLAPFWEGRGYEITGSNTFSNLPSSANTGEQISVNISWDLDSANNVYAEIDWQDGTTDEVSISNATDSGSGTHTYNSTGSYVPSFKIWHSSSKNNTIASGGAGQIDISAPALTIDSASYSIDTTNDSGDLSWGVSNGTLPLSYTLLNTSGSTDQIISTGSSISTRSYSESGISDSTTADGDSMRIEITDSNNTTKTLTFSAFSAPSTS